MIPTLLTILVIGVVYWFPIRFQMGRWGATDLEVSRVMRGDALIAKPMHTATQAITVDAPPEDIWPWLVQMGTGRGGLYSIDWLDRLFGFLEGPSADRILPEFQVLAVGDRVQLGPQDITVAALDLRRAFVLSYDTPGFQWVWQFGLYPLDSTRTRLVTRGTEHYANSILAWLFMRVMEPASFIMTWQMLVGLKHRAEKLRAERVRSEGEGHRPAA